MAEDLKVKVVTPQGSLLDEKASAFTARSDLGEFCILPNHRPIMTALAVGCMVIEFQQGTKAEYALDRGFLEAGEDHVNVVTEQCIPKEKLDGVALSKERAELEQKLAQMDLGAPEAQDLIRALKWAEMRLEIADKPIV
jgi:F-type H+-transporting ATPase subunit epsilon